MAEKTKKQAEPSDADPCSILVKAIEADNKNYNDQQVVAAVDAAEAILERASQLGEKYAETLPPEYVVKAINLLRAGCLMQKPMQWPLRVRVAKILVKFGISLKDEEK